MPVVAAVDAPHDFAALFAAHSVTSSTDVSPLLMCVADVDVASLINTTHTQTHSLPKTIHKTLAAGRAARAHPAFLQHQVAATAAEEIAAGRCSRADVLAIAAAALQLFVQNAFTGPSVEDPTNYLLFGIGDCTPYKNYTTADCRTAVHRLLAADGEDPYPLTPLPDVLLLALALLVTHREQVFGVVDLTILPPDCPKSLPWWVARALLQQQKLLDDVSSTLHDAIFNAFEAVSLDGCSVDVVARYHMEIGIAHHYYDENSRSKARFEQAQHASGFKWNITGALGKRTKFQQNEVTQLALVAESAVPFVKDCNEATTIKPNALALNDETLLETIEYTESTPDVGINNENALAPLDQCTLLAFCLNVRNTNPEDGLTTEQMMPFVRRVLENANNWSVHTMALLLRSRLEAKRSRTVERSVLQIQALVDQWDVTDSTAQERMAYIYSLDLPSRWNLERELGERFVSIGVTRSALQIFERLELWEDAINCLQMLEEHAKAEALINKLLQTDPNSPKLYCLLGDLKKDPAFWQKAWDISGERYARAMRSLGAYHFRHGEWEKSVECYGKALKLNSLFENSWFVMGCAAMRYENWEQAVESFSRVIHIDPENGEAWNNMASVFVHLGRKRDAWRAIKEGLRQHFDNVKIWENFLYVSIDLGEFQDAIRAILRILEIRYNSNSIEKSASARGASAAVDTGIVGILIDAVVRDIPDAQGNGSSIYETKVQELITEISSKVTNDFVLYHHFAKFSFHFGKWIKGIDYLAKAYRLLLNHPNLLIDQQVFNDCADALLKYVDALVEYGPREETIGVMNAENDESENMEESTMDEVRNVPEVKRVVCADWKYQSRTNLRTLIGRTKDAFEGTEKHDLLKEKLDFIKSC